MSCPSYYGATYYGSRGIGEPTEIPYLTQRLDDPPGIPFYIPCRSPLHYDEEADKDELVKLMMNI